MSTFLLLDVNYLCYRAFHAVGDLSYKAIKTGVIFGFMREVSGLQDRFGTDRVVFCFDYGQPKRRELFSAYKQKRHSGANRTEEEERARKHMHKQLDALRNEYLPQIGYSNVLFQQGYEADDIIASVAHNLGEEEDAIIVSADGDLYQLLAHNVSIFQPAQFKRPAKYVTLQSFTRDVGIHPRHWARVKAMSGCATDEIPGIEGVGEKTAIKYLNGTLNPAHKIWTKIRTPEARALVLHNKPLVKLPLAGTEVFELKPDALSREGWNEVCAHLGFQSMHNFSPFSSRASRSATFGLR